MWLQRNLGSLLLWAFLLWLAWGFVQGARSGHWNPTSAIVIPLSIGIGIAGYFYIKRKLGIRPAPRSRDLGHLLSLPFIRLPNEIKIAIRLQGDVTPLSQVEFERMLRSDVVPRLSDDTFICSLCKHRRTEFIAEYQNRQFISVCCLDCDKKRTESISIQ